ncbi:MAG TPA: hypothetical protein VMF05_04595 [Stellaceae bacterium]|nr:hypothetical protein [Stellaceae bacterium]
MWNITSHDVQQAKGRLQVRRAKLETRYAEETKALDAEFAAIETLERVAEEFARKHGGDEAPGAAEPTQPTKPMQPTEPFDHLDDSEPDAAGSGLSATGRAAEGERRDGGDNASSLDILKPGSRWRMYRAMRQGDGDGMTAETPTE